MSVLRNISWKALPISNVVFFVAGMAAMLPLVLIAQITLNFSDPATSFHTAVKAVASSLIAGLFLISCPSLAAGYVGGRIAKRQYALNGALGTAVAALLSLYELTIGPLFQTASDGPAWLETLTNVLTVFAGPLLGAYGGHLAELSQLRLDAMTVEERRARGFSSNTVVGLRWIAAFAVAAIVYPVVFVIGTNTVGFFRWLPAIATMAAIIAGTIVLPPQHRNTGCLLLMALAIAAPLALLVSHVSAGDAKYGDSFLVVYNALGALLTYQSLSASVPWGVQHRSKWWWLSMHDYARLSKSQRSARRYLIFVGVACGLILYFLVMAVADRLGADPHLTVVSFVLTLPVGIVAARPVCALLWPDMLEQADREADARIMATQTASTFD
jgi:MFS family permease